jgi:hypothetical protein
MRYFLLLLSTPLLAQSLRVYSEFAQVDAKGEVTAPVEPREILSPAIVRNGFTSFQIVVQVEPGTPYWLHVGQNPEDAVRVTVYRESGEKLEPVELPYWSSSTQVFWMDLWAAHDAPVRRIKVEPLLDVKRDWIEYPMEVRVMDATLPSGVQGGTLPPLAMLRAAFCTSATNGSGASNDSGTPKPPTLAGFHARNAQQDVALAQSRPHDEILRLMGGCESTPPRNDPEWYFKIRDYLFRLR